MDYDSALSSYRRCLKSVWEMVVLRRYVGTGEGRSKTDASALARVNDIPVAGAYGEVREELAGSMPQQGYTVIVLAQDLVDAAWPVPPKRNDKVIVRGKEMNVESVGSNNRRIGGSIVAWDLTVRG